MKKKPSKHVTLKQLRRARELFVEERCLEQKDRLDLALSRQVEYNSHHRFSLRSREDLRLQKQLWDAEVAAARLRLQVTAQLAEEYFDRVMAMVADPEFQEAS